MKRVLTIMIVACMTVCSSLGDAYANEQVVAEFGQRIAQAMCADGGAWIEAYKLSRESCPQISQSVLNPCMKKVLEGRAVPLKSEAELQQVSENLYACMKESFLAKYGANAG